MLLCRRDGEQAAAVGLVFANAAGERDGNAVEVSDADIDSVL